MIGVFDSGYGGLSVYAELAREFPEHDFIYLGDNARAPYGSRSPEIITQYTKEALVWLFKHGAQVVVIACNTASAQALPRLTEWLTESHPDKSVIGVINPVVELLREKNVTEPIGIIGTKSTVRSGLYGSKLKGLAAVTERACPLLAPLVEEGKTEGVTAEHILSDCLVPLTRAGISHVVLGCTHYYFLRHTIEKLYPHLHLYDASDALPSYLKKFFIAQPSIFSRLSRTRSHQFFTTDEEDDFARFVEKHLGISIQPQKISLTHAP